MPDTLRERFAGRELGIVTRHGKELAIGPAMLAALPLAGFRALPEFDTDQLGTFSGEVRREVDPRTTCATKARLGAEHSRHELVIANEGTFGPYPPAPFVTCDEEWLVLLDRRDGLLLARRHVALTAKAHGEQCTTLEAVQDFAARADFPTHGLILKTSQHPDTGPVLKGLHDPDQLHRAAKELLREHGSLWVANDLRAMCNPTRMQVIADAAARFAAELATSCPQCQAFHFAVNRTVTGLPCADCGSPTASVRTLVRECRICAHAVESPRQDGRQSEDPQYCELCNP
ncbi:MAG: DUF6671 family protein [Planctomycetota bacterium]